MSVDIAKDFVRSRFSGKDGVLGVLLVGSTSSGYNDSSSDVDLEVIATQDLCRKIGSTCGHERYQDLDVWWECLTLDELQNELKDWKNDINLWVFSKSQILLDPERKIRRTLSHYRQYPNEVWLEKLFLYWFVATGHAPYDSGKSLQRGDLLTTQLYLTEALEYYMALVFILNRSFLPYRKWRLNEFRKLAYRPMKFEDRLRRILTTNEWTKEEFEAKQLIVFELAKELEQTLQQSGVSGDKIKNPQKFKITYVPQI